MAARLEIDLAFDAVGDRTGEDGVRRIGLHRLLAALRSPRALRELWRGARGATVVVREDGLPPSAAQGAILLLAALLPARRRIVVRAGADHGPPRGKREPSGPALLIEALRRLPAAVAGELVHTLRLRSVVRTVAGTDHRLPRAGGGARAAAASGAASGAEAGVGVASALFLRAEPSVRWQGGLPVGGAATHSAGVINGLIANGVAVRVVAPEQLAGVESSQTTIVAPRRAMHLVPSLANADYSRRVLASVGAAEADFVYQRHSLGAFAGLELARRIGVPLVLELNSPGLWVAQNWAAGRSWMAGSLGALERRNLADASLIVVVSEVLKERLTAQGVPGERVLVNPNGVDLERLAPHRARSARQWRERLGQPQAPTVGFIGTFGPWHGVELLPELISRTPAARWIVIGAGDPLHGVVSAEIDARGLRDRVSMTGLVAHESALELLGACDVCVSPHVPNADGSRFFGSPTKLFEYMGLGKAIVASDLEQIGAVIEHERSGLLHPPGDVAAAAAAIRRLLEDPALRARLGDAALARARERFSWTAHARRTLDALEGGAADRRPAAVSPPLSSPLPKTTRPDPDPLPEPTRPQ